MSCRSSRTAIRTIDAPKPRPRSKQSPPSTPVRWLQPDDLASPFATCSIKMDQVSIDGLRQAFLDPDSRIRLGSADGRFESDAHMELVSLAWEGGFLDGVKVGLNPNLNVLIGGRGTGKSTVVESIRAVLGLSAIGDEARKAHEGIVRHVLRSGTKISLDVRVYRPGRHEYRIERTLPNPPIVCETNGQVLHLAPEDILPQVEVYGQHEIAELAQSREKLTRVLDRFVEREASLGRRKAGLRGELARSRRGLGEVQAEIRSAEERLAALPGMEETLVRFREVGLEERLHERSLLVREERLLGSIPGRVANLREALDLLRMELPLDLAFLSERALADLPGREILSGSIAVLEALSKEAEGVADQLQAALKRADEGIDQVRGGLGRAKAIRASRLRTHPARVAEVPRGRRGVHPPAGADRGVAAGAGTHGGAAEAGGGTRGRSPHAAGGVGRHQGDGEPHPWAGGAEGQREARRPGAGGGHAGGQSRAAL